MTRAQLIEWFKHNSPWLIPLMLYVLANLYNGLTEYPKTKSVVKWVLDIICFLTKKDSNGTLKVPFKASKAPTGKLNMRTGKKTAAAALLPFIALPFLVSSCYCWQPAGKNDPKCIVARQIIDCTVGEIKSLAPSIASILSGLINGNTNIDWDAILNRLKDAGIKDAGCILANLQNDFMSKPTASPEYMVKVKTVQDRFTKWKSDNKLVGVQFKITDSTGKTVLR